MSGVFKRNNSSNDEVLRTTAVRGHIPKRVWQPTPNQLRNNAKMIPTNIYRYFSTTPQTVSLTEFTQTTSDHHNIKLDLILTSRDKFTQKLVQKVVNFGHATKQTLDEYNQMFEQIYQTKRFSTSDEQRRIKEQMTTVINEFGKSYDYINDTFIRLSKLIGLPSAYYDFGLHSLFGTKFFEQNKVSVVLFLCSQEDAKYPKPNYVKILLKIIQTMSDKQKFDLDTMSVIDNPTGLIEDGEDAEGTLVTDPYATGPGPTGPTLTEPTISPGPIPELVPTSSLAGPSGPLIDVLDQIAPKKPLTQIQIIPSIMRKILFLEADAKGNKPVKITKKNKNGTVQNQFRAKFAEYYEKVIKNNPSWALSNDDVNDQDKIATLLNNPLNNTDVSYLLTTPDSKYTVEEFKQLVPSFSFNPPSSGSGLRKKVLGRTLRGMRSRKY